MAFVGIPAPSFYTEIELNVNVCRPHKELTAWTDDKVMFEVKKRQ